MRETFARRLRRAAVLGVSATLLTGCISPLYTWDTHSASSPRSFDVAELGREPVATLGLVAPASLQGFGPALSHALVAALATTSPPIRGAPPSDTVSALNEQGLASEYAELIAGFTRSGILERDRLGRIGSALGCRYVLLPGLAAFDHIVIDKFEIWGLKVVRNRVAVLRLWLQLWDARTGRIVWESAGEVTAASALVNVGQAVPLDEIAGRLWRRMIQEDLLAKSS